MPSWLFKILVTLVKWSVSERTLALQSRKPSGILGKYILQPLFINGNAELNAYLLQQLDCQSNNQVLEIGFGPGMLLDKVAEQTVNGHVFGLDFSETMFQAASERNQHWLREGKMTLRLGSSDAMPFEACSFDKVATANTLYFWQPPQTHLKEVLRVLKPKGQFVMGFRDLVQIEAMKLDRTVFNAYSLEEVETLLLEAGFEQVVLHQQAGFPFESYVAVATKP